MKGILDGMLGERDSVSNRLVSELSDYKEAGIPITVNGYQADVNRRLADMLLRDGPCTYMRSYSFDENGRVTGVEFERVKLDNI